MIKCGKKFKAAFDQFVDDVELFGSPGRSVQGKQHNIEAIFPMDGRSNRNLRHTQMQSKNNEQGAHGRSEGSHSGTKSIQRTGLSLALGAEKDTDKIKNL
jgi:hypothetical protein